MTYKVSRPNAFHRIGLRSLLVALSWFVAQPATAATLNVAAGGDFQAALDGAACGDTIVLQAGATYSPRYGFVLPYKGPCTGTDADYITVTTSAASSLPPSGTRLAPAQAAPAMAKLVATSVYPIISTRNLAHHWKFVGIEFTSNGSQSMPSLVTFGFSSVTGDEPTWAQRQSMKGFVLDRCFVHPPEISATSLSSPLPTRHVERGVDSEAADVWVINSYIAGFAGTYPDGSSMASEAILMAQGPGPLHIINNYLEAWYSSVFIGGSDAPALPEHTATVSNAGTIGTATLSTVRDLVVGDLVSFKAAGAWEVGKVTAISGNTITYAPQTGSGQPFNVPPDMPGQAQWKGDVLHDVEIRGNMLVKRPEWTPTWPSGPKNWIEVKAGRRVTIEGNLMTSGTPTNIAFTVRNQNGSSPWIEISGLNFRYNKLVGFKDPGFGIQLKDNEKVTGLSGGLVIENNLLLAGTPDSKGFLTNYGGHDVVFSHNTILSERSLAVGVVGTGLPTQNVTVIDNILHHGLYGMSCDGGGSACWPGLVTQTNVIVNNQGVGGISSLYPSGNFFPATDAAVGWVDPANGNYSLSASSPYKGKASDGTDPGVDMNGLLAALGGAASTPSPTPQPPAPTPTPAADTKPPTVAITSPSSGATVSKTVGVNVSASDNVGVTMTKYLVDGGIVGGFSPPSMNLSWDSATVSNGSHMISVAAYDAAGNSSQSTVGVNVANPSFVTFNIGPVSGLQVPVTAFVDCGGVTCPAFTYDWDWGDGSHGPGTTASEIHTYASGGSKSITLTVLLNGSSVGSTTQSVPTLFNPDLPPTAKGNCTWHAATAKMRFVDKSTDDGADADTLPGDGEATLQIVVDWGDGSTKTIAKQGVILKHFYLTQGTYTVTQTAIDAKLQKDVRQCKPVIVTKPLASR